MIDRPPSARCTRCGMPGPETRINERCSNTLNGKRCKGTFRSALNEGDWSICSACGGSRILEGRGCQYCHGSGWVYTGPR